MSTKRSALYLYTWLSMCLAVSQFYTPAHSQQANILPMVKSDFVAEYNVERNIKQSVKASDLLFARQFLTDTKFPEYFIKDVLPKMAEAKDIFEKYHLTIIQRSQNLQVLVVNERDKSRNLYWWNKDGSFRSYSSPPNRLLISERYDSILTPIFQMPAANFPELIANPSGNKIVYQYIVRNAGTDIVLTSHKVQQGNGYVLDVEEPSGSIARRYIFRHFFASGDITIASDYNVETLGDGFELGGSGVKIMLKKNASTPEALAARQKLGSHDVLTYHLTRFSRDTSRAKVFDVNSLMNDFHNHAYVELWDQHSDISFPYVPGESLDLQIAKAKSTDPTTAGRGQSNKLLWSSLATLFLACTGWFFYRRSRLRS